METAAAVAAATATEPLLLSQLDASPLPASQPPAAVAGDDAAPAQPATGPAERALPQTPYVAIKREASPPLERPKRVRRVSDDMNGDLSDDDSSPQPPPRKFSRAAGAGRGRKLLKPSSVVVDLSCELAGSIFPCLRCLRAHADGASRACSRLRSGGAEDQGALRRDAAPVSPLTLEQFSPTPSAYRSAPAVVRRPTTPRPASASSACGPTTTATSARTRSAARAVASRAASSAPPTTDSIRASPTAATRGSTASARWMRYACAACCRRTHTDGCARSGRAPPSLRSRSTSRAPTPSSVRPPLRPPCPGTPLTRDHRLHATQGHVRVDPCRPQHPLRGSQRAGDRGPAAPGGCQGRRDRPALRAPENGAHLLGCVCSTVLPPAAPSFSRS